VSTDSLCVGAESLYSVGKILLFFYGKINELRRILIYLVTLNEVHTMEGARTLADTLGRTILGERQARGQRPLHEYVRQSPETDVHAAGGIRTGNSSMRQASDHVADGII
jgi:hypothetical protein